MADCLASYPPDSFSHGCYQMVVVPGTDAAAKVRITWDLYEQGKDDGAWEGGIWLQRSPVEGQWKKYPKGGTLPPGTEDYSCVWPFSTATCYRLFSGAKGSLDLEFPPSMAGYVYEVVSRDNACTADRSSCGPSGGGVGYNVHDTYVFVVKASRYKNKAGEWTVTQNCPVRKQRKSSCQPAALAVLSKHIGGGDPTPFAPD